MAQDQIHALAVQAESSLEQLASGLSDAQVQPEVVQAVTQMADQTRQLVQVLGVEPQSGGQPPAPAPDQTQPQSIGDAADATRAMMQQAAAQAA